MTPLDAAHAAMAAAPRDDAARLAFYGLLAGTELFVMLDSDDPGDSVTPALFQVEEGRYLLAFDLEERLSAFAGRVAPYAALPGRGLVQMIAGQGIGIAFNADLPSAVLIPPDAVDWLAETLTAAPERTEARPLAFHPPENLPPALLAALDARLAASAGLARHAHLAGVTWDSGARGHVLVIEDALPAARAALAAAVQEALVFSGVEFGWLDVTFLAAGDPALAALAGTALRLDLPQPPFRPETAAPAAPGMDPDRPPRLR